MEPNMPLDDAARRDYPDDPNDELVRRLLRDPLMREATLELFEAACERCGITTSEQITPQLFAQITSEPQFRCDVTDVMAAVLSLQANGWRP
jgi:hypothetical protein